MISESVSEAWVCGVSCMFICFAFLLLVVASQYCGFLGIQTPDLNTKGQWTMVCMYYTLSLSGVYYFFLTIQAKILCKLTICTYTHTIFVKIVQCVS